MLLHYAFTPKPGRPAPSQLVVTVNSPDDPYPPTTYELPIEGNTGTVALPEEIRVHSEHRYELQTSGLDADGALSPAVRSELPSEEPRPVT
jgi:hypothetical protein